MANRKEEPNQLEAVHLHRVLNSRKFGGILLLQLNASTNVQVDMSRLTTDYLYGSVHDRSTQ